MCDDERAELLQRLQTTRALLADAEQELERALCSTQVAPRASKVIVDAPLQAALARLRDARVDLIDLERSIAAPHQTPAED